MRLGHAGRRVQHRAQSHARRSPARIKFAAVDRRRHAQELVPTVLLRLGALVHHVERAQYQIPQVRVAIRVVDAEGEGPIFLSYDREGGAGAWAGLLACRHSWWYGRGRCRRWPGWCWYAWLCSHAFVL